MDIRGYIQVKLLYMHVETKLYYVYFGQMGDEINFYDSYNIFWTFTYMSKILVNIMFRQHKCRMTCNNIYQYYINNSYIVSR